MRRPTRRRRRRTLSKEEQALAKTKREHRRAIQTLFRGSGFSRVTGITGQDVTFDNQTTELDDVFVYENVIVLAEYTCSQTAGVPPHLTKKKIIYDKILSNPGGFITFLKNTFPESADQFPQKYHLNQLILKIAYCSRYDFEARYKQNISAPTYMDYPIVRYFLLVASAIKMSARYELLHFLGIDLHRVGTDGQIRIDEESRKYKGSILPEAHSNFEAGFKVVSFYADPSSLLKTSYVLRKDGWRESDNLYQRMIWKPKIDSVRAYLKEHKRVFINNIIVTLPSGVNPVDDNGRTIDASTLTETAPVTISLPTRANSVGLIDGQHRVFAYHETSDDDPEIAQLRVQQNLLVTGIIYPDHISDIDKEKFEARLFLEINSTQTSAKAPLKQAIGLVLEPFSAVSIAARILSGLAKEGPLSGHIEQYFYDSGKLKTASIISFGLRPLVKTSGTDSLFSVWDHPEKSRLIEQSDDTLLAEYVDFNVKKINLFLGIIRSKLSRHRWTTDAKVTGRVLATTYINGFLIVLRELIERKIPLEEAYFFQKLVGLDSFDMSAYRSSQYNRLARAIVEQFFLQSGPS
jgi:DGQHR domain-containing protein